MTGSDESTAGDGRGRDRTRDRERGPDRRRPRRAVLAALGTGVLASGAGCLGVLGDGPDDGTTDEPTTGATTTPPTATATDRPTVRDTPSPSPTATRTPTRTPDPFPRWRTAVTGNADAAVPSEGLDGGQVELRVYRCSEASAQVALGPVDGEVRVAFEYTTRAEDWWELPYFEVREDGHELFSTLTDQDVNVRKTRSGSVAGSVDERFDVEGRAAVRFGIEPSEYCGNGDHGNTFLAIRELDIDVDPA